MKKYNMLIIGGDAAGMSAASQARRANDSMSICVLEKGNEISYAACGMPYYISNIIKETNQLRAVDKEKFSKNKNITILTEHEVTSIDFENKIAKTQNGKQFSYEKLVIATGARPFAPPITGIDSTKNIFYLRTLNDGIKIKEFIKKNNPQKGIIIGGGFIGLEMAESLRTLNIETTMLEKMPSPAMTMSQNIRELVVEKLKENNVNLHTEIDIESFAEKDKNISVKTSNGTFTADFVIVSVGTRPNTDFLKNTKLKMTDRDVISINEKSETNIKDVYAGGDCCSVKSLITDKTIYMPLGSTANKQGRVAGLQAAGVGTEKFNGVVGSQFVKVFDLEVGKTGFNKHDADIENIEITSTSSNWKSKAGYCPNSQKIHINLYVRKSNGTIIGGEIAGTDGAALRTNTIATAITTSMKIEEFAYLDLGYAPPFSPVWDPVQATAQTLIKREIK